MGNYKVYYDEIWNLDSKSVELCDNWAENILKISEKITNLRESDAYKGAYANNTKIYLSEIHGNLISSIVRLTYTYASLIKNYYAGYINNVDAGNNGSNYDARYTTIEESEVEARGTVKLRINKLASRAEEIDTLINNVTKDISDLVNPGKTKLKDIHISLNELARIPLNLNDKVINYESARQNDFANFDSFYNQVKAIITNQLSENRIPPAAYPTGAIACMCDIDALTLAEQGCNDDINKIKSSETYELANQLCYNRDAIIEEHEKAEREEKAKWVVLGVSIVAGIALTVVTLGGAGPIVCGVIGAVGAMSVSAANNFADNYIETGSLTEGMDWSKFGKDLVVSGVTGFITGALGAKAITSAATTLSQKVGMKVMTSALADGAEYATESMWDVGDAIITGKTDKLESVLKENEKKFGRNLIMHSITAAADGYVEGLDKVGSEIKAPGKNFFKKTAAEFVGESAKSLLELEKEVEEMREKGYTDEQIQEKLNGKSIGTLVFENIKKAAVSSATSSVENVVADEYKILNDGKKISAFEDLNQKTVGNAVGTVTGFVTEAFIDSGKAYVTNEGSEAWLKQIQKDAYSATTKLYKKEANIITDKILDESIGDRLDSLKDSYKKSSAKSVFNSAEKTANKFTDGIVERVMNGKFDGMIADVWEKDFQNGRVIVKDTVDNLAKDTANQYYKNKLIKEDEKVLKNEHIIQDSEFMEKLSQKDYNHDGKVEVVTFGDNDTEGVLLEDYEAAMEVAGKGIYKNKTAQEILGLSHDVDVSSENVDIHDISIDEIRKSDMKSHTNATTVTISYEEAMNFARDHEFNSIGSQTDNEEIKIPENPLKDKNN